MVTKKLVIYSLVLFLRSNCPHKNTTQIVAPPFNAINIAAMPEDRPRSLITRTTMKVEKVMKNAPLILSIIVAETIQISKGYRIYSEKRMFEAIILLPLMKV